MGFRPGLPTYKVQFQYEPPLVTDSLSWAEHSQREKERGRQGRRERGREREGERSGQIHGRSAGKGNS